MFDDVKLMFGVFYEISFPIQPNLKLKIWPKQLLGYLPLASPVLKQKAQVSTMFFSR